MAMPDRVVCVIGWGENREASVSSEDELQRLLDELAVGCPTEQAVLAEVTLPSGDALSIGLGHDRSVLSFVPGTGLPPYLVSSGSGKEGNGLVFYYYGHWTHFDEVNLISVEDALEVVRQFVTTGRLADLVKWQEV